MGNLLANLDLSSFLWGAAAFLVLTSFWQLFTAYRAWRQAKQKVKEVEENIRQLKSQLRGKDKELRDHLPLDWQEK